MSMLQTIVIIVLAILVFAAYAPDQYDATREKVVDTGKDLMGGAADSVKETAAVESLESETEDSSYG